MGRRVSVCLQDTEAPWWVISPVSVVICMQMELVLLPLERDANSSLGFPQQYVSRTRLVIDCLVHCSLVHSAQFILLSVISTSDSCNFPLIETSSESQFPFLIAVSSQALLVLITGVYMKVLYQALFSMIINKNRRHGDQMQLSPNRLIILHRLVLDVITFNIAGHMGLFFLNLIG